ncbi:MAG: SusC/RagA family TonB-linked outer membrane protein [Bacteroidales bacterium]|nr:SusC/RagA family TonB-linked outer membrane protein [Bacteroidales bacterium]
MLKKLFITTLLLWTSLSAFALSYSKQEKVAGLVHDENGEPLVGVFVYVKEDTKKAVQTDLDGHYEIVAPATGESYTLCFQYLGMVTKELPVKQTRKLNVVLKPDNELDAVMIVGAYGSKQRREDLVGSAYQVGAEELKNKPKLRVDNLLQGIIPGMTVEPNTDSATTTRTRMEVRVRGGASLSASNEPLWIIDGVPIYTGGTTNTMPGMSWTVSPLSFLDPDDIESITVLKDADQTTIYGADGANGIILVTTKSGRKNTPLRVSAIVNYGVSTPDYDTMFKVMNAEQYMTVAKESWANAGYPMDQFPYQDNDYTTYTGVDTKWPQLYLGMGNELYAKVGLRGGNDRITNSISASYYLNNNIVQKDRQQRVIVSSNQKITLWKGADLGINLQLSYNYNELFPLTRTYLETLPILNPYTEDGGYHLYYKEWDQTKGDWITRRFLDNDLPDRDYNDNDQRTVQTKGNFNFNWEIIKGLSINSVFGLDYMHSHEDIYDSMKTLGGMENNVPRGSSTRGDASYLTWTSTSTIRFNRDFGKHKVEAYGGIELRSQQNKYLHLSGYGFANDYMKEITFAEEVSQYSYSSINNSRKMSFFGRASYSYDSRYYLSANYRRDGNSGFGRYARWGDFWSVGMSWNIHKEPWFKSSLVSMLKFKASYGTSGNSRVDSSVATGSYNISESYSYAGKIGAQLGSVPNPGLSWEMTDKLNVGLRVELKNILAVEVEGYHNVTRDMLSKIYVSRTITDDRVYGNVGSMRNTGVEVSLQTYNFMRKDFQWTTTLTLSHNDNEILELYNGVPTSFGTTIWAEGFDKNTFNLVRWAGVDPLDGSPLWYDKNGDLTRTYSSSDRVMLPEYNSSPILSGALINNFTYKNWSLSFQINYTIGGYALATYASVFMNDGYNIVGSSAINQAIELYHYRWTTPGQAATFPKVSVISSQSSTYSTRFLYDQTCFNLSNVSLSYRFPRKWIDPIKLSGLSLSLTCDNVYLLTPDQKKDFNSYKTMKNGYPVTRTFTLGVNVNF